MEIIEAGADDYRTLFKEPYHFFNSVPFNQLNESRADSVRYLVFASGKVRLGLIAGGKDNLLFSPFSAPFGGFTPAGTDADIEYIDEAFHLLVSYIEQTGHEGMILTLPPLFYHENFITKSVSAALRNGFRIHSADLNHAFRCSDFSDDYPERVIARNARKNLRTSFENGLTFRLAGEDDEALEAYRIISLNRKTRGYPLRMTFDQVKATAALVPVDYFLIDHSNAPVAAAIVYHVSPGIVQVVYWGDDPAQSALRPMNLLSFKLFQHYSDAGMQIVDIGPSSENGIPSYGLADFKESIGCRVYLKFTLEMLMTRS